MLHDFVGQCRRNPIVSGKNRGWNRTRIPLEDAEELRLEVWRHGGITALVHTHEVETPHLGEDGRPHATKLFQHTHGAGIWATAKVLLVELPEGGEVEEKTQLATLPMWRRGLGCVQLSNTLQPRSGRLGPTLFTS